jgi:hypothetical protein
VKRTDIDCPKCGEKIALMDGYYSCWNFQGQPQCGYRPDGPKGTLPETKTEYSDRMKKKQDEVARKNRLAKIEREKQLKLEKIEREKQLKLEKIEREKQLKLEKMNRKRVQEDPEFRLDYWLPEIRKKYGNTMYEATKDVYVLRLKDSIKTNHTALGLRKFPSTKYPKLDDEPKGFLYVGVANDVNHRFLVHNGTETVGKSKPAKVATLGLLKDKKSFEKCGGELTRKFGIKQVGWRPNMEYEKVESWLGYALYKSGYWIWGPHRHENEDFLESGDFI